MSNLEEFTITTEKSSIDVPYVHQFLTTSYWAAGIPIETVQRSIEGSLCFSVFHEKQQVGFARVITDGATFAYLADVFIDPSYRGQGLSKKLMGVILAHSSLQGLRRFLLATRDAHDLYRKFGFKTIPDSTPWMQIHSPNIYSN